MNLHIPVFLEEVLLNINPSSCLFVDCTFGFGGHSLAVIKAYPSVQVIGFELDETIYQIACKETEAIKNIRLINDSYANIKNYVDNISNATILFDFGVNSFQQDNYFSFNSQKLMDLRFDRRSGQSAVFLIQSINVGDLQKVLIDFGDFTHGDALKIARILKNTCKMTQKDIARCIVDNFKFLGFKKLQNFLSRIWQALRIFTNQELDNELKGLESAMSICSNSRVMCITFHSTEDRLIKNFFKEKEREGRGKIITKKPVTPSENEIKTNSRARSAKLRIFEKLG